jgi:hypothetical protein
MILTVEIRIIPRNPYPCTTLSTTNPTWMDGPVFETRSATEISANNRVSLNTASGKSK